MEVEFDANMPDKDEMYNACMHQMRTEHLECACPKETSKWKECDCSKSSKNPEESNDNAAAVLIGLWPSIIMGIGSFGLVFCFIVAILAIMATRQSSALCCYSACSGLLALTFLAVGAVFVMIGLSAATPSVITTRIGPSLTWVGNENECPRGMATAMGSDISDDATMCLTAAMCQALTVILARFTILGLGIGIPYFVAGAAMCIACYASCCCKSAFEEHGTPGNDCNNDCRV